MTAIHAVNTWTLSGTRTEVLTAALLLRGPNPRNAMTTTIKLQAQCTLGKDGVIPPEFVELMETAHASNRQFLRTEGTLASMDSAKAAVDELERCLAAGMKGRMLRDRLMPLVRPKVERPVLRAGQQLFLYRTVSSSEPVVFTGVQPEPEVTLYLQRLIESAKDPQLSMTGMLNMASHLFSDEEVGMRLPRDSDMVHPRFHEIPNSDLIAKLGFLHFLAAPNGRYALGRINWGCGSPLGMDASQRIRGELPVERVANPFMAMVNVLMADRYALDVEFTTAVRPAHNAFNALCEALPQLEAVCRTDMSTGGYTRWTSPAGMQLVTLEEDYSCGYREGGPFSADKFDLEEEIYESAY